MFEIKQPHYHDCGAPNPCIKCARCMNVFEADQKKLYELFVARTLFAIDNENLICDRCADETGYQDKLGVDKPLEFPEKGCTWGDLEMTPWPAPVKKECATCEGVGDVFSGTPCGTCYGHDKWRG